MEDAVTGRGDLLALLRDLLFAPEPACAVLTGPPGIGKTRVASLLLEEAAASGREVLRAGGSRPAAATPLGALAAIVPEPEGQDAGSLPHLQAAISRLQTEAAARDLLLFIDDIHLLDDASLTLLDLLVRLRPAPMLLAADSAGIARLAHWWIDDRVTRFHLEPFDRAEAVEYAVRRVGGIDRMNLDRLWHLSQGNPGRLEMLVRSVAARPDSPTITIPRELEETVNRELNDLRPETRDLLELISIAGSLPFAVVEEVPERDLEELERLGLVTERYDGRRRWIEPADRLVATVLRDRVPPATRRRLARQLHDGLASLPDQRADDLLSRVRIARAAALPIDRDTLLTASVQALFEGDDVLAAELAGRVLDDGPAPVASLVRGESLLRQGLCAAAEETFATADLTDANDELRTHLAIARGRNQYLHLRDIPAAVATARSARDRISDANCGLLLDSAITVLEASLGSWQEVVESGGRVLATEGAPAEAVLPLLALAGAAQLTTGDLEGLNTLVARGLELAGAAGPAFAGTGMVEFRVLRSLAGAYGGDLVAAAVAAAGDYESVLARRNEYGAGIAAYALAHVLLLQGVPGRAIAVYREARKHAQRIDPYQVGAFSIAEAAVATVAAGRAEESNALLSAYDTLPTPPYPRARSPRARAAAWSIASTGDLAEASRLARAAGDQGREEGRLIWAAFAYHDAVTFGHASLVADRLSDVAGNTDAGLVSALARHGAAARDQDPAALADSAHQLEAMGAWLPAAAAASRAANLYARYNESKAMIAQQAVRERLLPRLGDVWCPALRIRPQLLTSREFEIASLAALGMTSRSIAERLVISIRTVDNHLASVYAKLDIAGRSDLPDIIGIGPANDVRQT